MQPKLLGIIAFIATLLFCTDTWAQNKLVRGKVQDENGSPLSKATIMLKGSKAGISSSDDGSFEINVSANTTLVVTAIGYNKSEVKIAAQDFVTITLSPDGRSLNEVVVTALGIKREKRNLTFSSQEIRSEELVRAKEPNILNAMTGKVAGVQITSSTGAPGSSSRIVVRGVTSIFRNNEALIVVDGVPINNSETGAVNNGPGSNRLLDIDPAIIESVNVLKGAAATALYGSAGARGVVMITTKTGNTSKKPAITISQDLSFENGIFAKVQDKYAQGDRKEINGVTYDNVFYDGDVNKASSSWGPLLDTLRMNGQPVQKRNQLKDFFQTGVTSTSAISFSGSNSPGSSYFVSYSYLDQKGIVPTAYLKRHSLFTKFTTKLTDKIAGTFQFNYANNRSNRVPEGYNLESPIWTIYAAPISWNPLPYLNADGTQRVYRFGRNNPYWVLDNVYTHGTVNRFLPVITLNYAVTDWLNLTERMGADLYTEQVKYFEARGSVANPNGVIVDRTNTFRQYNHDLIIDAHKQFNKFNVQLLLGNNVLSTYTQEVEGRGVGLSITGSYDNVANASTQTYSEKHYQTRKTGFYSQANFDYNHILNLAITGRYDGSSVLAQSNSFYPYGSAAAGFVFSELFTPRLSSIFNFGKIRVSYATVGNDNVDVYSLSTPYQNVSNTNNNTIGGISFPFQEQNGFLLKDILGNPNLKNELVHEFETGIEVKALNNRIGAEVSWFNKKVQDGLIPVTISPTTGYNQTTINTARMQTKGVEILLNANPVQAGKFNWDLIFSFTKLNNKVLALREDLTSVNIGFTQAIVGQPYGVKFGTRFARDSVTGQWLINANGLPFADPQQGILGNISPDWLAGLTNNLSYGPLSLSFFFDMKKGGVTENNVDGYGYFYGTPKVTENREVRVVPGISTVDGKANTVPVKGQDYWRQVSGVVESVIQDATYIKLRNVSLGYVLPAKLIQKTPLKSASLTVTGRNLWIHSPHFTGGDPETNSFGSSNGSLGIYSFSTPTARSVNISLKIGL
ncbi:MULTISPECIES: SusC/RagA family TonB-linked outer membrane protein [Niastella]|uniref:SusC/RagA family TonB-linked outer membrane protein n=1 Tax=Niastella soli TaxID=2821487 RepID=A0ABS3YUD2_9BACT|nr:SusC/RagA family TonB-linked outer membrane protein [Niastella soli]MBO9201542.1 SusC/RagA family TonB-linked outer membrane protein [Niastella soli]